VFLCCLLLPFTVRSAEPNERPLTVVSDDNYPPYIFRDSDGNLQGYLVDVWALWESKTGRSVHLVGTDWAKAQQMMMDGQGDVIDTIFQTPDREKTYDFMPAYAEIAVPIYVHESIGGIANSKALRGFLVGVKAGDACIERLQEAGLSSFQPFNSYADLVDAAVGGKIKIFCLDEPPANYLLYRANADHEFYKAFTLYSGAFHRAVRKGDLRTLGLVEQGFDAMSGKELQALHDKWMGARTEEPFPLHYFLYGFLVVLAVGGTLSVWVFSLHHQVRRRTKELDQQRSRLRAVLHTIPDLVWLKDANGVYLTCNPPFERLFGAPESEIVGKTDFDFTDAEQARFFRQKDQEAIAAGKPTVNEERVIFASDGRPALLETIKTPMTDESGLLVGVLGIARDITRMRGVEEDLRQSEALLLQSQRLASIGHFVLEEKSGRLKTSAVFDEIFGIGPDHPRSLAAWLTWVHPDHRAAFAQHIRDFLREGGQFEWQCPILRTSDGTERWVKMSAELHLDEHGLPATLFGNVQDITEHKKAEAEIQQLAFYDSLTKLPNRRLLQERLTRAKTTNARTGVCGALMFIDIDNFKTLNDTRGHQIGDLLLEDVAKRLNAGVRQGDTVARFGGDEFIVMVDALSDDIEEATKQAGAIGDKLLARLAQPYALDGYQHHCAASLGITLFCGADMSNDDLLKQADLAMYQAKAAGRNTKRFFDPQMQDALAAHADLEASLRLAIDRKEFTLYFQPQIARNGDLVGAEGLIRWHHPERGLVFPAEFIPVAESSGLILPIGLDVLEMACQQLVAWRDEPATRNLSLAINVSARQFHHPAFVDDVRRTLLSFDGADPTKLKLELTESVLLQDIDDCVVKMTALQALGVRLALDDFGTGYSSLVYLKRLPFSQLKIDRSFVRDVLADPNDAEIARTIILLAKSFGLKVIAEGVEQEAQWRFLSDEGCDEAQGYLYGRPMPADDFLAFAKNRETIGAR
jgi:diguanylate cyclase (GGDEF)-like protein/PAS domain S-box-containing protein